MQRNLAMWLHEFYAYIFKAHMLMSLNSYCKHICATRLSGVISPYNSIRELQQYASGLVMSEPCAPNITLSQDVQTFAMHGKQLHLPTMRAGLRRLFNDVSTLMDEVLLHQDIPIIIPNNLSILSNY